MYCFTSFIIKIFFFEKYISLFQFQQTISAKTSMVTLFYKCFFFSSKTDAIALTIGDIAHLAFKRLIASRALFFFMLDHKTLIGQISNILKIALPGNSRSEKNRNPKF